MLGISWGGHRTGGEVLHKMRARGSLLNTVRKRICQCFGHVVRGGGVRRLLVVGKGVVGGRGRGRAGAVWTDGIRERTGVSYNDCIGVARGRERWRSMTADLLTTDGT